MFVILLLIFPDLAKSNCTMLGLRTTDSKQVLCRCLRLMNSQFAISDEDRAKCTFRLFWYATEENVSTWMNSEDSRQATDALNTNLLFIRFQLLYDQLLAA